MLPHELSCHKGRLLLSVLMLKDACRNCYAVPGVHQVVSHESRHLADDRHKAETSPKITGRIAGATLAGNLATRATRLLRCKRTAPAGGGRDVWAREGHNRPSLWP